MIRVSKIEAAVIREKSPESHVTVVNRQSNHKKYFVEENRETNAILREMRKENVIYRAGDFGPQPKPKQTQQSQKSQHSANRHRHTAGFNNQRGDKAKEQDRKQNDQHNFDSARKVQSDHKRRSSTHN